MCLFVEPCSVVLGANHLAFNRPMYLSLTYQEGGNKFLLCYPHSEEKVQKNIFLSFLSVLALLYIICNNVQCFKEKKK